MKHLDLPVLREEGAVKHLDLPVLREEGAEERVMEPVGTRQTQQSKNNLKETGLKRNIFVVLFVSNLIKYLFHM